MQTKLRATLAGYRNAVRVASRGRAARVPDAIASVLRARLRYRLGPFYHSLFGLAEIPTAGWDEFIVDNDSNPIITHGVIGRENLALAGDKIAFTAHCVRNGLPTIPITCVIDRAGSELAAALGAPNVASAAELEQALAAAPDRLFVKLIDGSQGAGAFIARRQGDGWEFEGRTGSAAELYRFALERLDGRRGWLMQPIIVPHPALGPLMPRGVLGTIRAVTYLTESGPHLVLPLLRIPAGGSVTDNFAKATSGNLVAPIDPVTGTLGMARHSRSRRWPDMADIEVHPDTGQRIPGFQLPCWRETVELLEEAQRRTPQLRTLGWDIAITEGGPLIVEANADWDANILQVVYRRGIRRDLAPIFALSRARAS